MKPIIKAVRDVDLYCTWSSISNLPELVGTRAELEGTLRFDATARDAGSDRIEDRFARADATGTSALPDPQAPQLPAFGAWDDRGWWIGEEGWLPRSRLAAFLRTYPGPAADALLWPAPPLG